jgi:hypothetical protein
VPDDNKTWPVQDPGDGRNPTYFENPMIDALVTVTMELGAAQWVQAERLRIIEQLLTKHGAVTTEMIEKYVPSDTERAAAKRARDAFIGRIYGAFERLGGVRSA